jgi:hypothetical protein
MRTMNFLLGLVTAGLLSAAPASVEFVESSDRAGDYAAPDDEDWALLLDQR